MPPPSPSLILLDRRVGIWPTVNTANLKEHVLTSGAKLAIGFSEHDVANTLVRGLELGAHLAGETDLSSVSILRGGDLYSCIHTVDKNLLLVASAFLRVYPHDVFLIYDAIDGSLRMIPTVPYTCTSVSTALALVARPHNDNGDKSYALAFPGMEGEQDVLYWAMPTSTSTSTPLWQTKNAKYLDDSRPNYGHFNAHDVFSFGGRGYWVDLLYGVFYCDCNDVLSDKIDCVDIRSLDLPVGCKQYLGYREDIAEAKAFRAMGPVGDSVKFVSIDGYLEHLDLKDCKVRVWTLMADMHWAEEHVIKFASLWGGGNFKGDCEFASLLGGGDFKGDGVPLEMVPMYPFLSTQEDNVIYFALGNIICGEMNCFPDTPCRMLRIDFHSKILKCTRLSEQQRSYMGSHLALSSNAAEKLLHRKIIRERHIEAQEEYQES